ncbi:MAG: ATP synthase subunit I [Bryobacterales bacterium]|nr:ATP synthase subunit I [Bryobacterales bacterium]
MSDPVILMLVGGAGLLLGVFFFGGLWWTVRWGVLSKRPALWFLGSLVVRTGIVLAGMYFVSGGRWDGLLACLVGLITGRFIVTRLTGPPVEHSKSSAKEASYAP